MATLIDSQSFGIITLTGESDVEIEDPATISQYARDATDGNYRTSVSDGTVPKNKVITINGFLSSNSTDIDGDLIDPILISQQLHKLTTTAEPVGLYIGYVPENPEMNLEYFSLCAIRLFKPRYDDQIHNGFQYQFVLEQPILVDQTYSSNTNVSQGTASMNGSTTDIQYKSLTPSNYTATTETPDDA